MELNRGQLERLRDMAQAALDGERFTVVYADLIRGMDTTDCIGLWVDPDRTRIKPKPEVGLGIRDAHGRLTRI